MPSQCLEDILDSLERGINYTRTEGFFFDLDAIKTDLIYETYNILINYKQT